MRARERYYTGIGVSSHTNKWVKWFELTYLQAMFETKDGLKTFLATGCAERSDRTYVRIWIRESAGETTSNASNCRDLTVG